MVNTALITSVLTFSVSFFFELNHTVLIGFKIEQELLTGSIYKKWIYYEKNNSMKFDTGQIDSSSCELNNNSISLDRFLDRYLKLNKMNSFIQLNTILKINCFQVPMNLTNSTSTSVTTTTTTTSTTSPTTSFTYSTNPKTKITSNYVDSTKYLTILNTNTTNIYQSLSSVMQNSTSNSINTENASTNIQTTIEMNQKSSTSTPLFGFTTNRDVTILNATNSELNLTSSANYFTFTSNVNLNSTDNISTAYTFAINNFTLNTLISSTPRQMTTSYNTTSFSTTLQATMTNQTKLSLIIAIPVVCFLAIFITILAVLTVYYKKRLNILNHISNYNLLSLPYFFHFPNRNKYMINQNEITKLTNQLRNQLNRNVNNIYNFRNLESVFL